ncbi:hypothetical protein TTHT_1071 [Thermotomaculum hydrothermale]|uniref:Doubled CXXCH motif domain-containing protein n=1 Tax=Thermotomaculum hydrothermale TaxID=981385 RepID=A0A7R6SYB9_9BACT|nr:cytochrome c3 family protein [Thermotomaculum hydrothermale]BBB32609.1 hypothetical protein TTHT_1071 [Thermotomaculum hydrothermale]
MKKTVILLVMIFFASMVCAANRFNTVSGEQMVIKHKKIEDPETVRQRMNTPYVKKIIEKLRKELAKNGKTKDNEERTYVGSEYCLACHTEYSTWKDTNHARTLRVPKVENSMIEGKGVIADYNQNGIDDFVEGLDFNEISSPFDPYKPYAPKLSVKDGVYTITIGDVDLPVVMVNGGMQQWRERYIVRIPATDSPTGYSLDTYFSVVQYNLAPHAYEAYKAKAWYKPDGTPKIHNGMTLSEIASVMKPSFSKNCIGCHTTGIRHLGKWSDGEWEYQPFPATLYNPDDPYYLDYDNDGIKDILNVGCEACHGPGSAHILGGGDPTKIVNPDKLDPNKANETCGRCHNRVRSVPNKTFNWPYNDSEDKEWNIALNEPLQDYYINANEFWPDGVSSYEHNQHYSELNRSKHVQNPYHVLRCFDCHDPHGREQDFQIVTSLNVDGVEIKTSDKDDTLCLACHASHGPFKDITPEMVQDFENNVDAIGKVVSAHTHHPFAPDRTMGLSRCTLCHMTAVANTNIESVLRDHSFEVIPPEKTLMYQDEGGMPNTCADSCHNDRVNLWKLGLDPTATVWNEDFDVKNATILKKYFGPEGLWWIYSVDTENNNKK